MSSNLNPKVPQAMDLAALRAKLAQENGKRFWQSLEELSETKEYREFLENEFPHDPEKDPQGLNRRDVLKLAAASAARRFASTTFSTYTKSRDCSPSP